MIVSNSKFADVAGLDEVTHDVVIPNGKTWELQQFQGASAYLDDTVVCLVWDPDGTPEILACTHGDTKFEMSRELVGDGVKKLRIALTNDTNTARVIGASYEAREL